MDTQVIIDVTEETFDAEVLKRSAEVPVVVDFWAAWCGPCRTLGPILERAVTARAGSVVLARVDVDAAPRLAATFFVRGIPAVKAFKDGAVVDEFVGAQPVRVVEQFLDALVPSAAELAVAEAATLGPEEAAERYRAVLAEHPDDIGARAGLARLPLDRDDPVDALELLEPVAYSDQVAALAAEARLSSEAQGDGRYATVARELLDGGADTALETLLELVRTGDAEERASARDRMLDAFRLLGDEDPRTQRFRRSLTLALY